MTAARMRYLGALVAAGCCVAGCSGGAEYEGRPVPAQTATLYPSAPARNASEPAPDAVPLPARVVPAEVFGEGMHLVIEQIKAGIYRTGGSQIAEFPLCSWRLLKGARLVAAGSATGPVSIVVEPVYTAVESRGCLEWKRVP